MFTIIPFTGSVGLKFRQQDEENPHESEEEMQEKAWCF